MERLCNICKKEGKYKCPICPVYYCSVACCQNHRTNKCELASPSKDNQSAPEATIQYKYTTMDTVPLEKLHRLKESEHLKGLLANPHLRSFLLTVNNSKKPEEAMQVAMQEPLFLEFADVCLKIVEPQEDS